MNPRELRNHCLSFRGAEETFPFAPETSVFKVAGRIFAITALVREPLEVSLKCDPVLAERLRQAHPCDTARIPPEQAALEHGDDRRFAA